MKIKNIINSTELRKRDDGTEFYAITDNCDKELHDLYLKLIYDDNIGGKNDLSYQIINEATAFFDELEENLTIEEIEEKMSDYYDFADIYNETRLSYINNSNESEIADILKEYSCKTISQACAVWYENMTKDAIQTIINKYLS